MADDTNAREALIEEFRSAVICAERDNGLATEERVKLARTALLNALATPADRGAPAEGADAGKLAADIRDAAAKHVDACVLRRQSSLKTRRAFETAVDAMAAALVSALAGAASQAGRDALDAKRWRWLGRHWATADLRFDTRAPGNPPKSITLTAKVSVPYADPTQINEFVDAALATSAQAGKGEQA